MHSLHNAPPEKLGFFWLKGCLPVHVILLFKQLVLWAEWFSWRINTTYRAADIGKKSCENGENYAEDGAGYFLCECMFQVQGNIRDFTRPVGHQRSTLFSAWSPVTDKWFNQSHRTIFFTHQANCLHSMDWCNPFTEIKPHPPLTNNREWSSCSLSRL